VKLGWHEKPPKGSSMIVMKFGGSSIASPARVKRVASIIRSQAHRYPVVVVSALGDTTDTLSDILKHASRGEAYLAWKKIKALCEHHHCVAEDLLDSEVLEKFDLDLRGMFRDVHVMVAEICDGERRRL
jgi:aspartokinase